MGTFYDTGETRLGWLTEICDIILLNVLFLVSCIPIVTIGTAVSALYSVTLKMVRREYPAVWRAYLTAFRENFRQSTQLWLCVLAVFLVAGVDYVLLPILLPDFSGWMRMILAVGCTLLFGFLLYGLPMQSRFVCTNTQLVKNAVKMFFGYFPTSVLLVAIHAILPVIFRISPVLFLTVSCGYLVCGFSVTALLCSRLLNRIFRIYEP